MNDVELRYSMWPLSQEWYGHWLDPEFSAKPLPELRAMLTRAGLTSDFWQLSP